MKKLVLIILMVSTSLALSAQRVILDNGQSELSIFGTSTLHDWEIKAEKLNGSAQLVKEGNQLKSIEGLTFEVEVNSLKSGKSGMDDNTYKALKSKQHPKITYNLENVKSMRQSGSAYIFESEGTLTIAGASKRIPMQVRVESSSATKIQGETTFKMTDFQIDPPTAMFGSIRTGDEITIKFNVTYK